MSRTRSLGPRLDTRWIFGNGVTQERRVLRNGLRVTVVGGGIGGLSTALLLSRIGAQVTMVERVPKPGAAGVAIALYPNGLAVLYGLGLRERLHERAFAVRRGMYSLNGRVVLDIAFPDFGHGLDHVLALTRSALHQVLYDATRRSRHIDARFGHEVIGMADGRLHIRGPTGVAYQLRHDLVVGADGVHSTVRAAAGFAARRVGSPSIALRALVLGEGFGQTAIGEHWSRLGIAIAAPLGDGTSYLALGASRGPLKTALQCRDLPALRRLAGTMLPGADRALGAADRDLLITPVQEVRCARWSTDNLVLLGDAAHAMTPHLGQGASSTLLDAAALAAELSREQPSDLAIARYVARRKPAATRVQNGSRMHALVSERFTGPGLRQLRDTTIRLAGRLPLPKEPLLRSILQEDPAQTFTSVRHLGPVSEGD
ncbi:MAG: FAD-dependent oxidoreductase [Streptosporangiales bacterium]|nr:FAD-dependent oxidoreductase [Streptosporangiales bacterium]